MDHPRKTVLVTGAGRGIGAALVSAYAARGAQVIAVSRGRPETLPDGAIFIAADIGTDDGIAAVTASVAKLGPPLDILVNNAGLQQQIDVTAPLAPARIDTEIAVNLAAPVKLTLALLPFLRAPGGSVVNVTSLVALHPKPSAPAYSATKAGLASFTHALRHQLRGTGIAVSEAVPPLVATDMTAGRGKDKLSPEAMAAAIIDGVEAGRTTIAPGKARLVLRLNRFLPSLVARILAQE